MEKTFCDICKRKLPEDNTFRYKYGTYRVAVSIMEYYPSVGWSAGGFDRADVCRSCARKIVLEGKKFEGKECQ